MSREDLERIEQELEELWKEQINIAQKLTKIQGEIRRDLEKDPVTLSFCLEK